MGAGPRSVPNSLALDHHSSRPVVQVTEGNLQSIARQSGPCCRVNRELLQVGKGKLSVIGPIFTEKTPRSFDIAPAHGNTCLRRSSRRESWPANAWTRRDRFIVTPGALIIKAAMEAEVAIVSPKQPIVVVPLIEIIDDVLLLGRHGRCFRGDPRDEPRASRRGGPRHHGHFGPHAPSLPWDVGFSNRRLRAVVHGRGQFPCAE